MYLLKQTWGQTWIGWIRTKTRINRQSVFELWRDLRYF